MSLALNKPKLDNLAGDIWKSAERLRGKFKPYEYQGVILPIIVIRRLECVLLAWREAKGAEVLAKRPKLTEKELAKLVKELELNPKQSPFSNKTDRTLRKIYEEDHALLEEHFRAYINGFSKNVDEIIEHFNYRATIASMVKNNRLAPILNQYKELALGPDQLSGLEMGYIYEELLRRFSEQSGEEAGSRIAIVFNGSALSNGDCGHGGSQIRRWILENDWLDAIVMLPDQLFYNTGIFTYIWLLRNEKPASHRGRVMLIDARQQFEKEPKAFASKRNRMTDAHREWIEQRYRDGWAKGYADEQVKIFRREDFAYHKVSVVFWQLDEHDKPAIVTEPYEKAFTVANVAKRTHPARPSTLNPQLSTSCDVQRVRQSGGRRKDRDSRSHPQGQRHEEIQSGLQRPARNPLRRMDAPALRAGRRIHPIRREHRGVSGDNCPKGAVSLSPGLRLGRYPG